MALLYVYWVGRLRLFPLFLLKPLPAPVILSHTPAFPWGILSVPDSLESSLASKYDSNAPVSMTFLGPHLILTALPQAFCVLN